VYLALIDKTKAKNKTLHVATEVFAGATITTKMAGWLTDKRRWVQMSADQSLQRY